MRLLNAVRSRPLMPAAAICARCDKLHEDRDVDTELLENCIGRSAGLMVVGAERLRPSRSSRASQVGTTSPVPCSAYSPNRT